MELLQVRVHNERQEAAHSAKGDRRHSRGALFAGALYTPVVLLALAWVTGGTPAMAQPGVRVLEIFEIQGSGRVSPHLGETILTRGNVVTAVADDGFFIQTLPDRSDGDPDTSDGLFVFTGHSPTVSAGDLVDVTGKVNEFFGLTELSGSPAVSPTGIAPLPAPTRFDASTPSPDPEFPSCAIEYECYEGMLIAISGGTVTGPSQRFYGDPIAEAHVTAGPTRALREPGAAFPGLMSQAIPVWDSNPEVFELDPDALGLPNRLIPAGSTFDATGVLSYEFGGYEMWPTLLTLRAASLPRAVRMREPGEFTVGTLNAFRLFDDVDDPPSLNAQGQVRGDRVVTSTEYETRLWKLANYIAQVLDAPDILALQEIEKIDLLQALARDIALLDPDLGYSAYLLEGNDVGTIDTGFLVRDTVRVDDVLQLGAEEILSLDASALHDRPPLVLDGSYMENGAPFRILVMAVHMRSLTGIADEFDGERVRRKRLEQAESVARMVQAIQEAEPAARLLVLGDFNAFQFTDGFVDVVGHIRGRFDPAESLLSGSDLVDPDLANETERLPAAERYSFVFRGTAQALDHALRSRNLSPWLRGAAYGRGNADAGFHLLEDPSTPLRASDHDGLVLFVMSDSDADGVPEDLDRCPGTEVPESTPIVKLGVNRYALVDSDHRFDTLSPHRKGRRECFTLSDAAGCSCGQIVEALGLGKGHLKFGCGDATMRRWVVMARKSFGPFGRKLGTEPHDGRLHSDSIWKRK